MILVTGACGFVGSHLVDRLIVDRRIIEAVDNMSSNVLSEDEIRESAQRPHLLYWLEPIEKFAMRGSGGIPMHGIYHLASPVGPAGILKHSGNIVRQIVDGTYAVIELALRHECRLVYVSTSEIYNGGDQGFCSETTPCIVPLTKPSARLEYAIGKMAGEIAVMNTPGLDAVIVRLFNVAGPRQSPVPGFVLPRFVQQTLAGQPLTVFGDGSQRRAFTHVFDIVDGLVRAMERGQSGQAYNLGNPANQTTISDLGYRVILATGADPARVRYMDGKEVYGPAYSEANDKFPNADKAMSELGWKPLRSIDETIQDVIEYERSKVHVD